MRTALPLLLILLLGCADNGAEPQDTASALAADADGDGYNEELDCNDDDATVYPYADELCDTLDNDCDGDIDESPTDAPSWYPDVDRDGHGEDDDESALASCDQPEGRVASHDDCDDGDAGSSPALEETCGDGLDNNCDGQRDESTAIDAVVWYLDADGDGYGDAAATSYACSQPEGYVSNDDDCFDAATETGEDPADYHPGAPESCDGTDHDCDGQIGEEDSTDTIAWYLDRDEDGYGGHTSSVRACGDPSTDTQHYTLNSDDCDDTDAEVNPGAEEACDAADNNCDGAVDEGLKVYSYQDADGDGYGDSDIKDYSCPEDTLDGYVASDGDCFDDAVESAAAEIYPGAPEYCNGYDDDCDDDVDEDDALDPLTWYLDADEDGYGDPEATAAACTEPDGYVVDGTDCDDSLSTVNPSQRESCDATDNDCDGEVDEGRTADGERFYVDLDGDGYGKSTTWTVMCALPPGYSAVGTDCDDSDADISPGAEERCDKVDNNCNGELDGSDSVDAGTWYRDADLDGLGDAGSALVACERPSGYVEEGTDCDDGDPTRTTDCGSSP